MTTSARLSIAATILSVLIPLTSFAADVNVSMTDNEFIGKHITVYKNDKVIWTNNSEMPHTVTSDAGLFNSGQMTKNQSYWRTFPDAGVFPYYCAYHGGPKGAGMSGTITVIEAPTSSSIPQSPLPNVVSGAAASAAELQAQIADLLARVTLLQQGAAQQSSVPQGAGVPSGSAVSQCIALTRALKRGASGDDVSRLQAYLAQDTSVYPEQLITGFYGSLTELAVQRYQCKHGIVCEGTPATTGYGSVGPRTMAHISSQCTGAPTGTSSANVGGFIKVTPTSGAAPLTVLVEATLNTTRSCAASLFEVNFGDGTPSVPLSVPGNTCADSIQRLSHVYAAGGTYKITLKTGIHETSAQVVVSGGTQSATGDTLKASTNAGPSPLSVTFSGVINAQGACGSAPYTLQFGDNDTATLEVNGCSANAYTVTHIYSGQGNFSARLLKGTTILATIPVSVYAAGAGTPNTNTGTGGGGTISLTAGANGNSSSIQATFTIPSSCSRFEVDWGDGTSKISQDEGSCAAGQVTKTYTHTYQAAGNYTFTLKRGASLQYTDSAAITISN